MPNGCVEVWYNRVVHWWRVQPYDNNGTPKRGIYCESKPQAISVADGYGVPVVFTTPERHRRYTTAAEHRMFFSLSTKR